MDQAGRLRGLFRPDQPFGPHSVRGTIDEAGFRSLFDERNSIAEDFRRKPTMIVGRRGSGKTTFLHRHRFDPGYDIIVSLAPDDEFPTMVRQIEQQVPYNAVVEEVARTWNSLFWVSVFKSLTAQHRLDEFTELRPVRAYLDALGIKPEHSYYSVMRSVLNAIAALGEQARAVVDVIEELTGGEASLGAARAAAIRFMHERGLNAVILIDSLEEFPLDAPSMEHTMKGLLHAVGGFNDPDNPVELRCCLPSELYPRLRTLSAAPLKDFGSQITLRWKARELLHLCALRYQTFIRAHNINGLGSELMRYDLGSKPAVQRFWSRVLPPVVTNCFGQDEPSIAYIMRHTQLLPRHAVMVFNAIAAQAVLREVEPLRFRSEEIVSGVRERVHLIVEEIFTSHRQVFPDGVAAAKELLRALPPRFDVGTFHAAFNRYGKRLTRLSDYHDALHMLIQIGAIGVVTGENERYVKGLFEYTEPHNLSWRGDDELCVHPVFIESLRVMENAPCTARKPIYPTGSTADLTGFDGALDEAA